MKPIKIDQSKDRHIVNVPIPFTREQLTLLVKHCCGFEPKDVGHFVNHIIASKKLDLNPSSSLGDGANVVNIFNFGFVTYMKTMHNLDIDPSICWWHPLARWIPTDVRKVDFIKHPVHIVSLPKHQAITKAIESSTGKEVTMLDGDIMYTEDLPNHSTDDLPNQ